MSVVTEGAWAVTGECGEIIGHLRGWIEDGTAETIREAAGLDRVALGACLGVEWQAAQRIEGGQEVPGFDVQRRYARLLQALYPLLAKEDV